MRSIRFFIPTLLVLGLVLGAIWLKGDGHKVTFDTPVGLLERGGITMLSSTVPASYELQSRCLDLLAEDASTRGVFIYAITNITQEDFYYYVSVAGLPIGSTKMDLSKSVWLGVITISKLPGLPGIVDDSLSSQPVDTSEYGKDVGGAINVLPFRDGTTATYGVLGVHNCGFSLNGWRAVDLFPAENMVYSTNDGQVSYVCRDGTQVALRIAENLYTHLVDTGQATGQQYTQGQAIAGMVPGTYEATCGYADQQPDHYHVHFCFIPNPAGTWSADGYALNVGNGNWVKGGETVAPLGTLTADWANAGISGPAPAAGSNFWDGIVEGVMQIVEPTVDEFPDHQEMGIADRVVSTLTTPIRLIYLVILINFKMDVVMWVVGIVTVLEGIRLVYAAYMWVKRAIPVIG